VLDNVKFHYSPRAIEIETAGAHVVHRPAYSPDLNPIEECISKIKEALRSFKARTKRTLYNALAKALALVTADDIHGPQALRGQGVHEPAGEHPEGILQMH
jgi:transposase